MKARTLFVLGDKQTGYSIHYTSSGWASGVWFKGELCRTDLWPSAEQATEYAFGRAQQHYGRGWIRKHRKQFERATGATVRRSYGLGTLGPGKWWE